MGSKFVWYDLNTTAPAAARDFYAAVFGWTYETWGGAGYTMFCVGGSPRGGFGELPADAGVPNHWIAHTTVPDLDAAIATAKAHGATFPQPIESVPTIGRFTPMIDPQGAVCSLYQPEQSGDMGGYEGTHGAVGWNELTANDPAAAKEFYSAVVGWKWRKGPSSTMDYWLFGSGEQGGDRGGMMQLPEGAPRPSWLIYFSVDDCDATVAKVVELGGTVLAPQFDVPGIGRLAVLAAPDGAVFAVAKWAMG
ncbi:MAG: VOC family protein [Myxococcales bacterium]|nr:VOC family protein [Myxococcales bacterium]